MWILWNFDFYFSDWSFSIWNSVCVVLTQITRFLLGDLLTFFTLQACIFYNFIFYWFFGMKLEKNFSVMVNALKFLYLFKWFGLFYLEFWVGVFFDTIDAFSFVWFFDSFHPLRVNCLKLSPSWDLFWWKWTKNYSCKGKSFYIFIFSLVIRVILSRNLRGCFFGTIHTLVNSAFL